MNGLNGTVKVLTWRDKMGRPTKFTPELGTQICSQLADGLSLRKICEATEMPSIDTVRRWLLDDNKQEFQVQYVRAREEQADYYADAIIEEADKATDRDSAAAAKVKVDARKWVASKLKPKKYGDKLDLDANLTGNLTIQTVDYKSANDTDTV